MGQHIRQQFFRFATRSAVTDGNEHERDRPQRRDVLPEVEEAGVAQHDAARDGDEVGGGNQLRQRLDRPGQRGDREDVTGEQHRRQQHGLGSVRQTPWQRFRRHRAEWREL